MNYGVILAVGIIGFAIGSLFGISLICLFQINYHAEMNEENWMALDHQGKRKNEK